MHKNENKCIKMQGVRKNGKSDHALTQMLFFGIMDPKHCPPTLIYKRKEVLDFENQR